MTMKRLPREYLWFVERVLREHPGRERELESIEEAIAACCHAPTVSDMPGGSASESEPERVMEAKEHNEAYQRVLRIVRQVERAVSTLTEEEKELVEWHLWNDLRKWEVAEVLGMEEKPIWRMKTRILRKVAPYVLGDWAKVSWTGHP